MNSLSILLSTLSIVALLGLGGCSSTKSSQKDSASESSRDTAAAASMAQSPQQGTQLPGGQTPGMQQGGGNDKVVTLDESLPAVNAPQSSQTPSSAPPPMMAIPPSQMQGGAPASDSPAGTLPPGMVGGSTVGRPASEQMPGNPPSAGGGAATKSAVEMRVHSQPGLQNVTVEVGADGCVTLGGMVATAPKREEAEALARSVTQGGCVVNKIAVK